MQTKGNRILPAFLATLLLFACPILGRAQLKIVDEKDGKPIAGAYVFSNDNHLLCMSDANGDTQPLEGTVTISVLSYEPKTIDASKTKGTVSLRQKPYALPEVVVHGTDYLKLVGAFRDICRNDGKTILYREGIMNFYINMKTHKIQRRVRACRQYECPKLRSIVNFNIAILGQAQSTDLSRIRYIKRDSVSETRGDTTFYRSTHKGKTVDDAIMYIDTHRDGVYRHIIDNNKYRKSVNAMLKVHTALCDWTFSSKEETWSSLLAFRSIYNYDYMPLPGKKFIASEEMKDFVVTEVLPLSSEQAKAELKDKSETADFTLPDCLPPLPYDVAKETKDLLKKKFWEM